jgi:hypothetical protein
VQAQFQELLDIKRSLREDIQRQFDKRIATELRKLKQEDDELTAVSKRSIILPDNVQRFQRKIPTANEFLQRQAARQLRQQAKRDRKEQIEIERQEIHETQASTYSHITVRPRSPVWDLSSTQSSSDSC